jgi:hypothetical protein
MTPCTLARLTPLLALLTLTACPADETDTDAGAGSDSDSDTGTETDTQAPWTCDDVADYHGDSGWTWGLNVPQTLTLCGTFDEGRTLADELKVKAQLQIPAGRYALPNKVKGADLRLPACVRTASGSHRVSGPIGAVDVTQTVYDGRVDYYMVGRQSLVGGGQLTIVG